MSHPLLTFAQLSPADKLCCAGEIACGYASGCFTLEQAMLIAYHRGRLPTERGIAGTGLMAATGLSAAQCKQRVAGTNVVMACDNSPTSTTVSGAALPLQQLFQQLALEQSSSSCQSTLLPVRPHAWWVSAKQDPEQTRCSQQAHLPSNPQALHIYLNLETCSSVQAPRLT